MSTRSRLSTTKRTKVAIALAAVLGLLGGIAIHRSRSAPHAQSPGPSVTKRVPLAGNGTGAPLTSPTRPSDPVPVRSGDPGTVVGFHNQPPRRGLFGISGVPSGPLAPGLSAWLNLVLTNPNAVSITVRSLTVRVRSVSAPRAEPGHSCGSRDFTVAQFSGGGLRLRPTSTTSLARLGIAPSRWPRVSMLDRAVNQDGCKGASLTLDYRGVGR